VIRSLAHRGAPLLSALVLAGCPLSIERPIDAGFSADARIDLDAAIPIDAKPLDAAPDLDAALEDAATLDAEPADLGFDAEPNDLGFEEPDAAPEDAQVPMIDGGASDATAPDAVPVFGPFSMPMRIMAISSMTSSEDDPSVTEDGLELFFNSDRGGQDDIWVSTRTSTNLPWGPPREVIELNSPQVETTAVVSADGYLIRFASSRPGSFGQDIWFSTRATRTSEWAMPRRIPELSEAGIDACPVADRAALTIFFCSDRAGGLGGVDIYQAVRVAPGVWGNVTNVLEVNSAASDTAPVIRFDNRIIYFASGRPGGLGTGHDLYFATRTSSTARFGAPMPMSDLNSMMSDEDPWLTEDLRTIYFSSTRDGDREIYTAER
jgi:hypothetical protein